MAPPPSRCTWWALEGEDARSTDLLSPTVTKRSSSNPTRQRGLRFRKWRQIHTVCVYVCVCVCVCVCVACVCAVYAHYIRIMYVEEIRD